MEKIIAHGSYWLGVACLGVAVIWKVANAFGLLMPMYVTTGHPVSYLSFLNGTILSFLTTIATTCHAWFRSQKP